MIKRILLSITAALLLLTSNSHVFAQGESSPGSSGVGLVPEQVPQEDPLPKMMPSDLIMPPYPGDRGITPFSGQLHNYSVVFRGNGESIVTLRVALTNTNDTVPLKETTLRLPEKVNPQDLSVYQILVQGPCTRYEQRPISGSLVYPTPNCVEYGEPDYYYYYGNGKYQKAMADYSGDTLKVTLPTPIEPNKTGSFFVYFRGFGLTQKNLFGAYKYDFESFKVADQVNQLTVGISTDADQFLKGAQGEVDYRFSEASTALKAAPAADAGAVANSTMDRFVSQIGQGQLTKTASNLASLETYKVEGMYASSRAKLYGKELVTVLGVIVFFVILVGVVLNAIQKRVFKKEKKDMNTHHVMSDNGLRRVGVSAGISFASTLVTAGYTIAIYAIANALSNLVDYQYQSVVMILLVVISFAVYLLLIVGPALYVGFKNGLGWGIGTFIMTIVWLIFFAVITVSILFVFRNEPYYPPVPLVRGGMDIQTMEK